MHEKFEETHMKHVSRLWLLATRSVARSISSILILLVAWIIFLKLSINIGIPEIYRTIVWLILFGVAAMIVRKLILKLEGAEKK